MRVLGAGGALLALAVSPSAAGAADGDAGAPPAVIRALDRGGDRATVGDTLYLTPLGPARLDVGGCFLLCATGTAVPAPSSGSDADLSGMRLDGPLLLPGSGTVTMSSDSFRYDAADGHDASAVRVSYGARLDGPGGATARARLDLVPAAGGAAVASVPEQALERDGTRHVLGPVRIDPKALTRGGSYRVQVTARVEVPSGASTTVRFATPRLVAIGPEAPPVTTPTLRLSRPGVRLSGRRLRVEVRCPTAASVSCRIDGRVLAGKRTLRKLAAVRVAAGARKRLVVRLTAAQRRRAGTARRLTVRVAASDGAGARDGAERTIRVSR
ncbi:hypothetical protein [Patulibacter defluvii]|uniref:hypothetical protein n=1 Tax=Patulibacter defluvii TaxID=3095358 RepID=UPI002A74C007|nr:hypothetical protein [Patulibacter sp. DM4]